MYQLALIEYKRGSKSILIESSVLTSMFSVDGKEYKIFVASDISSRDGIGAELWLAASDEIIAEVFRDDTTRKITFSVFKQIEIPLQVLDALLRIFDEIPGRTFIDYNSLESSSLSL